MHYRTFIFVAFVNILSLFAVGDGSALGLGLLSPLLPVASITGHAGLWAHGLSGVALLKLKAAAALGALFAISGRGIEINLGNDHHGHDDHGHGWSRRRRDVSATDAETFEKVNMEVFDPSFDQVLSFDSLGCGMRLVCEMSAASYEGLGDDEKLILELFARDGKAPLATKVSKAKLTYTYASILGANAKDGAQACGRVYAQCPYSRNQIMESLREAQV
ncbi:hypothetical protein Ocin01_13007 [Orchesella cincta]|uniref:Uncharacterized protein n=1 Tax=Orchesella cincta TaxID=48709 RepID=A0A1D2ML20_ORCCI|nr:hypothetical protein Ocin01_13007 [Orchesella cincta]